MVVWWMVIFCWLRPGEVLPGGEPGSRFGVYCLARGTNGRECACQAGEDQLEHRQREDNRQSAEPLTDGRVQRGIQGDEEPVTIRVGSQLRRQLVAYGKNCVRSAKGNLGGIAECALKMTLLNRPYLEAVTCKFVRYAKAEGFENDQHRLMDSLLNAR